MNRHIATGFFALLCLVIGACASPPPPPTEQELEAAYYGSEPTLDEVRSSVRYWMTSEAYGLKYPDTLKGRNVKVWRTYVSMDGRYEYGYLYCFEWDAKTSFDEYNGFEVAGYLFRDGKGIGVEEEQGYESEDANERCRALKRSDAPE
jgi:hypothetical protein